MKKLLLMPILFFVISFSSFAQQKETKIVEVKATKMEKTRGENPNIKTEFVFNAPDVAVPKPEKSRGDYCTVNVDNWTGYDVYVYVDGDYKGYVAAWSEGEVTVYSGFTTVYVRTTGGTYYWSTSGNCDYYFNYKITL